MELLGMLRSNADAAKEAEAHWSLRHSMVPRRPADSKASWCGVIRVAALHHSIHQCHCCASRLQQEWTPAFLEYAAHAITVKALDPFSVWIAR